MASAATKTTKTTATPKKKTTTRATTAKKPAKVAAKAVPKTVSKPATISKTTAIRAEAVKSATRAAPTPKVVTNSTAPATIVTPDRMTPDEGLEMKKKELIDKVVLRSGIKKKDAKPVIEAMLAVLGEALSDGRPLNLQPLGKVKINRMKQVAKDRVIICKIRQSGRAISDAETALNTSITEAVE